jgi:CheY-like chemotaxis protein
MPGNRPLIVVIDDHPLVRAGYRGLLEAAGYGVAEIASSSGLAAVIDEAVTASAIIADIELHDGSTGIGVALTIMSAAGRQIPTMVISGTTDPAVAALARANAMPLYRKPTDPRAVMAWVGDVVQCPD